MNLLKLLESDSELLRDAGQRGRQAFLKFYDKPLGVARICAIVGAVEDADNLQPTPRFAETPVVREASSASAR